MGTLICGLLMIGLFLVVVKMAFNFGYQSLLSERNDGFIKKLFLRQKQQKETNLRSEFLDANQKRGDNHGYLTEHILRIMQKNSDEFNEAKGHNARMQFVLGILEFKHEFADQNEFQKAFKAAMNMYTPGEMKKRTGKGGLGMTYSDLSLNKEFAQAKKQHKMLVKA
jgi:hypothetical protein